LAVRAAHAGIARRAASIASAASPRDNAGTRAISSPLKGSTTGRVAPDGAAIQRPSTWFRSRRSEGSLSWSARRVMSDSN